MKYIASNPTEPNSRKNFTKIMLPDNDAYEYSNVEFNARSGVLHVIQEFRITQEILANGFVDREDDILIRKVDGV